MKNEIKSVNTGFKTRYMYNWLLLINEFWISYFSNPTTKFNYYSLQGHPYDCFLLGFIPKVLREPLKSKKSR